MVYLINIDRKDSSGRDIKSSPVDVNKYRDYHKINVTEKKSESRPGSGKMIDVKEFKHNSVGEHDKKGNIFNQNIVINSILAFI